jgi:hypothetical protein
MPYKKKADPKALMPKGYEIDNKLMDEMKKKRANIVSSVQFRHDLLESQKRINYQNEFDRLQGAKKLSGLDQHAKSRMQELQKKARQSLKGDTHRIYSTKIS